MNITSRIESQSFPNSSHPLWSEASPSIPSSQPLLNSPEQNLLMLIQQNIEENNLSEGIQNLFLILHNVTHLSPLQTIYTYLFKVIPYLEEKNFAKLLEYLPKLLELSSGLHEEQRKLAICLASRYSNQAKTLPLNSRFLLYFQAMDLLAAAILIAESLKENTLIEEMYKAASKLIIESYLATESFQTKSETAQKEENPIHSSISPTQKYRQELRGFRSFFANIDFSSLRNFQLVMVQKFKDFFQLLLNDAFAILGKPPCDYDILEMGPVAREEVCPFSGLVLYILVEQENKQEYFETLLLFLELQARSLGETANMHPVFSCIHQKYSGFHQKNRSGFHFDLGGNHRDRVGLPKKIAQLQCHGPSVSLNTNSSSLFEQYQFEIRTTFNDTQRGDLNLRQYCALGYLKKRYHEYQKAWPSSSLSSVIDLKSQYIRLLHDLLADMSLYWEIDAKNTLDIIDALVAKQAFTKESGELLKKGAATIYALQIRLHLYYGVQNEEAYYTQITLFGYVLQKQEVQDLQEICWLILYPLYESLASIFEGGKKLEEAFKLLDLPLQAASRMLQGVKTTQEAKKAQPLVEVLERYPNQAPLLYRNRSGLSLAFLASARKLEAAFLEVTTSEPEESLIDRSVNQGKITSPSHVRYIKPQLLSEMCDNEGNIKQAYPGSAHPVFRKEKLHFKQKPTHPLMGSSIHNLLFRIAGDLTPASTLVRCEVQVKGTTKMYPLLLSTTVDGSHLMKALDPEPPLDATQWARWTWMFLCTLLIRPGDGRFSNYILDPHQRIFSIHNDAVFVEPAISDYWSKTINFCSALFCLFPKKPLDHDTLKQFCTLDIDAILAGWIEDVIELEKAYLTLFTEAEREELYQKDANNRFKATILFREGTLTLLNLQFYYLQNYLRSMLSKNQKVFPLDLLRQIVVIQKGKQSIDHSSGEYVFKAYEQALLQPIKDRLKAIISRNQSMTSSQADLACLGKIPTFEEIEKKKLFTPTKAKEELFMTLLSRSGDFTSKELIEGKKAIHVSFENIQQGEDPDQGRQILVLLALIFLLNMKPTKPSSITIHGCAVLESNTLELFLHKNLEYLELRLCNQLKGKDVELISKKCPRLKTLFLAGSPQLRNVALDGLFAIDFLTFPNLEQLYIMECKNLSQIKVRATFLKLIKIDKNPQLYLLDIETDTFPQLDVTKCFLLDEVPILKRLSKNILGIGENGLDLFFNNLLQPASWFALANVVRENPSFKTKLFHWIDLSQKDPRIATKAANAISILTCARISFFRRDFRGVRIPGANLAGANLTQVDLRGADLRGVNLSRAILNGALLEKALMDQVEIGHGSVIPSFYIVSAFCSHPQKNCLICGYENGSIEIRDTITGRVLKNLYGHTKRVSVLACSSDGKFLASGSDDTTISLWDLESGQELRNIKGHTGTVTSLTFSNDGKTLASGSDDQTIGLWNFAGRGFKKLEGLTKAVTSLALSSDGVMLAVGSDDKTIRLLHLVSGRELKKLVGHTDTVPSLIFLNDGKTLASGSKDQTIRLWDLESGQEIKKLEGGTVMLLNDGKTFVSVIGEEGTETIRLCNLDTGQVLKKLEQETGRAGFLNDWIPLAPWNQAILLSDGKTLALRSFKILLWDVERPELKKLEGYTDRVRSLIPLNDGKTLASGSDDGIIRLWDLESSQELKKFEGHTREVTSLTLLKDKKTLVSGSFDRTIRFWDLESGRELKKFEGRTSEVTSLVPLNDGKTLAWGDSSGYIYLLDIESGQKLKERAGHNLQCLNSLILLNDGKTLASGGDDGAIRLWSLETEIVFKKVLRGHLSTVNSLILLNDGKTLASGGNDGTIRLWDLESGQELKKIEGHRGGITSLALLNDGKTLASGSRDHTIRLWNLETTQEIFSMSLTSYPTSLKAQKPDLLYVGGGDGELWCWQMGELGTTPLLLWSTYPMFSCKDTNIENCIGLSEENRNLMIQYGAKNQ